MLNQTKKSKALLKPSCHTHNLLILFLNNTSAAENMCSGPGCAWNRLHTSEGSSLLEHSGWRGFIFICFLIQDWVLAQGSIVERSWTHLLSWTQWVHCYKWNNFLYKNLKFDWVTATHQANEKTTSKWETGWGTQSHHKTYLRHHNPQLERNSKPRASPWGENCSHPTSGHTTFKAYTWAMGLQNI